LIADPAEVPVVFNEVQDRREVIHRMIHVLVGAKGEMTRKGSRSP
jgi:hypothetical protein